MTAEQGRKEALISWLALAILPSLDSFTPSAKWRGWRQGRFLNGQPPLPSLDVLSQWPVHL